MPHDGYFLRTGGSARRRVIKPTSKQTLTDRFPIPTVNYKVSGVPGHTHNSSAVLSVLCDLQKTRGRNIDMAARVWCEEKTQMEEKDPGDSEVVDNEDARFERALERGIGEICMRPENCHEEIREPVRSISEIRTLVAPSDRLQTLTYVEELGGFVNQDGTPFLSDYNDVFVNILGDTDPIRTETVVADVANLTRASLHTRDVPMFGHGLGDPTQLVVLIGREAAASAGTLEDGSAWNGVVRFRWDPDAFVYRSDSFVVTLNRCHQIASYYQPATLVPPALAANAVVHAAAPITVRVAAIETSRASNGSCFISNTGFSDFQLFTAGRHAGSALRPRLDIEVHTTLPDETINRNAILGMPATRIMVGGHFALYGPVDGVENTTFLERVHSVSTVGFAQFLQLQSQPAGALLAGNGSFLLAANRFGRFGEDMITHLNSTSVPEMRGPMNVEAGGPYFGVNVSTNATNIVGESARFTNAAVGQPQWTIAGANTVFNLAFLMTLPAGGALANFAAAYDATSTGAAALRIYSEEDIMDRVFSFSAPAYYDANVEPYDDNGNRNAKSLEGFLTEWPNGDTFYNYDHAARLLAVTAAANDAAEAVAQSRVMANANSWNKMPPQKFFEPSFSGDGLSDGFQNVSEQMLVVPMQATVYLNDSQYNFERIGGVGDPTPRIVGNPTNCQQFYLLTDAVQNTARGVKAAAPVDNLVYATHLIDTDAGAVLQAVHLESIGMLDDTRAPGGGGTRAAWEFSGFVGQKMEILIPDPDLDLTHHDPTVAVGPQLIGMDAQNRLVFQDAAFQFETNRRMFLMFNDVGTNVANLQPTVIWFDTNDVETGFSHRAFGGGNHLQIISRVKAYRLETNAALILLGVKTSPVTKLQLTTVIDNCGPGAPDISQKTCLLFHFGVEVQKFFDNQVFADLRQECNQVGPVWRSQKRISQHLCAPVLNPNSRIGCVAPLNFETMHLPPELRDFKLELRGVDFSFLPGTSMLENLMLYEFNGGNQVVAADQSLLHLPQFHEKQVAVDNLKGTFDFEMFSPYGIPSYFAIFARDLDMSKDHERQPLIKQLSIMCNTTMKKSNTILNANVHQLYHITQRNVNQRARYNRHVFNHRQCVLLSAEDVGLMGLDIKAYQKEKRSLFRFHGAVNQFCRLTAVLVYNNRGLHVYGKQLRVVRLQN